MNKVLIVDSDKENLKKIETGFAKSKQYQIMTASNAKAAVDILNKTDIATLVSGMKLFGFSGIELIAYMTWMFPSTPCIALLDPGQPTPYFKKSAKSLPVLQFIEKPVDHKQLAAMIAAGIKQKSQSGPAKIIYLENFLPLIVNNRRTCQIDIKTDRKKKGSLYFSHGELIDARWEKKTGENAVSEMLSWERAKITVSAMPLNKKDVKINFDLMGKMGISWDKRDEPILISIKTPEDTLPDTDVVDQLEKSLKKISMF